jgi:hypothetical protein
VIALPAFATKTLAVLGSRVGSTVVVAALAFGAGWKAKDRIDENATLRAVIAKKDIDLRAAKESAEITKNVLNATSERDAENQETIRDLQERLSKAGTPAGNCSLDDDAVGRLRRLK